MVTHNITLNVKQQGPIDTGIEVTQGDYGQVRLVMRVKDDDSYITNATGAEIVFSIPNGYFVVGNVTVSSGTYTYIFAGNELQCPGKIAATLTLKFADGRVSSCTFTFECRYNPAYDRRIQAGPYVAELEKLKQQAQEQVEYLETLIEQLQGDFDATVLTRADLVNNGLAANAGIAALDAVQANPNIKDTLAYKIDRLNSKFTVQELAQRLDGGQNSDNATYFRIIDTDGNEHTLMASPNGLYFDNTIDGTWSRCWQVALKSDLDLGGVIEFPAVTDCPIGIFGFYVSAEFAIGDYKVPTGTRFNCYRYGNVYSGVGTNSGVIYNLKNVGGTITLTKVATS